MSVRVRFAPSPTGYLHIGGARTALYNYLYSHARGGKFILRIEDTDLERSSSDFEKTQVADLKWLGIIPDEGPSDYGYTGDYGPYRQSERTEIYNREANKLLESGKAFYCFCTDEELTAKKEKSEAEGLDPRYDGTCHHVSLEVARARLAKGETASIRFKAPKKAYVLNDHVKHTVTFPEDMVGDFVIVRSNGLPVYNYCCVVDDAYMKITHVIRGDDHLNNTVRQLMIYEAMGLTPPEFSHLSLLVGQDRQKLSKRHAATSVINYKEQAYLPEAMNNYLTLLGWSHPSEVDIFTKEELFSVFDLNRFSKSPATFDLEKFAWVNAQHIKKMTSEAIAQAMIPFIAAESLAHKQTNEWRLKFVDLYKDKVHFFTEFNGLIAEIFSESIEKTDQLTEILAWETTPKIKEYVLSVLDEKIKEGAQFIDETTVNAWMDHIKTQLGIKGKPLFMGFRAVLTGRDHGPELKQLLPLTPVSVLTKRIHSL